MDDQEVMRDVYQAMLESLGYNVVCVDDGQKAISLITEEIKAGTILAGAIFDLTVPGGIGGCEAVEQLRHMGINIPVFAASGHADDPVFAKYDEYGFTGSIAKPFRKTDLVDLFRKHCH